MLFLFEAAAGQQKLKHHTDKIFVIILTSNEQ